MFKHNDEKMKYTNLFELAKAYLERNDFGSAHTKRVFDMVREIFDVPAELEDLVYTSVILHDIGGSSVRDQYEKGPEIATSLLHQLGYKKKFIHEVCKIIRTHHDHPENPSQAFRILFDSDRLVMFSRDEFPYYSSRQNFDWEEIIDSMYSEHAKHLAKMLLYQRKKKSGEL